MKRATYRLLYNPEFANQLRKIERKFHSLIRETIVAQLVNEPDSATQNRKLLNRPIEWGARWELRFGENNEFRIFYSVYPERREVHILAIGIKERERLFIGGKEVKL